MRVVRKSSEKNRKASRRRKSRRRKGSVHTYVDNRSFGSWKVRQLAVGGGVTRAERAPPLRGEGRLRCRCNVHCAYRDLIVIDSFRNTSTFRMEKYSFR